MAQRSSRKRRKQRQRSARETAAATHGDVEVDDPLIAPKGEDPETTMARGYARGRAKDEAARAALKPLAPGERPLAVSIAGAVALVFGLINFGAYVAGETIGGERPSIIGVGLFTGLMFIAAYGCFRMRYWAVLGVQALLGLLIVIFSVLVISASSILTLVICIAVIVPSCVLFWFLVKSMARLQMPERPGSN